MKKIEIIWREILYQAIEKKNSRFTQKDLAQTLKVSTSTIFQALKDPRRMGAVRVGGRFFSLEDWEKLLYHWASVRNLDRDIIFRGHVDLPVLEIEGLMPPDVVFGLYSACRLWLGTAPADYDKVYVYAESADDVSKRYEWTRGRENLFILAADSRLGRFGQKTTLAQTFVDLWNLGDWQAKEYVRALAEKIDGLLS